MKTMRRTCPKCGRTYQDYPALSRVDNKTEICPECGVREALEDAGIGPWRKRDILIRMAKERFKPGMRIRLIKMDDVQAPPVGTEGTVRGVDDIGSILVAWDTGGSLNVVLGEDEVEIIGKK